MACGVQEKKETATGIVAQGLEHQLIAEQNGTQVWASAQLSCETLGRSLNLSELTFLVYMKAGWH